MAGAFSWMLRRLMESFCAAGQETERCYITEIPNAASPSDLDPWTHGCHREKAGRIMFSLLELGRDSTWFCVLQTQQNSAFIT